MSQRGRAQQGAFREQPALRCGISESSHPEPRPHGSIGKRTRMFAGSALIPLATPHTPVSLALPTEGGATAHSGPVDSCILRPSFLWY